METFIRLLKESFVWKYLACKRMKALYWTTFAQFIAAALDIVVQMLTEWNPEAWQTVFAGLVIAQITKYLNTPKNG